MKFIATTILCFGLLSVSAVSVPYLQNGWIQTLTRLKADETTHLTLEIWVNPKTADVAHHLIEQYSTGVGRQNFQLVKKSPTTMQVKNWLGGAGSVATVEMLSVGTVPVGEWSHIAWVCDGQTWRLYINGTLDSELDGVVSPTLDTVGADGFVIGNSRTANPNGKSNALFAEARVWKCARTSGQIASTWNKRIRNAWNEPDLIGYWPLTDGQEACESNGGFRNYATMPGSNCPTGASYTWYYAKYLTTAVTWESSNLPISGDLDGDSSAAEFSSSTVSPVVTEVKSAPESFTLTGWFLLTSSGSRSNYYFTKFGKGNGRFQVYENNGNLNIWIGGGTNGATNETLTVNIADRVKTYDWHHLAVVKDGKRMSVYINGELVKEGGPFDLNLLSVPLCYGGLSFGNTTGTFSGLAKDIGFWSRALDPKTVSLSRWCRPTGKERKLLGYWTDVADESHSVQKGANMPIPDREFPIPGLTLLIR